MTISQSSSRFSWPAAISRLTGRLACWRSRRRTQAELARLAEVGDYLLRDVGLDPDQTREDVGRVRDAKGSPPNRGQC
jgi:uncharacterized protein YjiS (DUF1127 family)